MRSCNCPREVNHSIALRLSQDAIRNQVSFDEIVKLCRLVNGGEHGEMIYVVSKLVWVKLFFNLGRQLNQLVVPYGKQLDSPKSCFLFHLSIIRVRRY
jgi:hypothetical protein